MEEIKLLDTVALVEAIPAQNLQRGQVGTVVEILGEGVFEVEFSDERGEPYAMLPLRQEQIMLLYFSLPAQA